MSTHRRPTSGLEGLEWYKEEYKNIDVGLYADLHKKGQSLTMHLEEIKSNKDGKETPYLGMSDKDIIEKKIALKNEKQPVPLTAYERTLKAAGIVPSRDSVGKFYEFSDTDVLFPEMVSTRVYAGLLKDSIVPEVVSIETQLTDSYDYRKIWIKDTEEERQLGYSSKGAELTETFITVSDQSVKLRKHARYLQIAYEDARNVRLNLFGVALERIGKQIQIDETEEMIRVFVNGDGNSNTPGTTIEPATTDVITVADVIEWATGLPTPYKMSHMIGRKALLNTYYATLAGMDNARDKFGFIGVDIPRAIEWDTTGVTTDNFYGLDRRYSMEHLTQGGVQTDSEKIVKKLSEGTAIWHYSAFSVLDENANGIWDITYT